MIWAGIAGLGAVWGWLVAQRSRAPGYPGPTLRATIPATFLPTLLVLYVADWQGVMLLFGSAGFSYLSYFIWLHSLRSRVRERGGVS